jgi:Zn finger protein HypA/HybF involved in hydrogenase expression
MFDYEGLRMVSTSWFVLAFVRVLLWIKRAQGLRCRSCGLEIVPQAVGEFVVSGCPACRSEKLEVYGAR